MTISPKTPVAEGARRLPGGNRRDWFPGAGGLGRAGVLPGGPRRAQNSRLITEKAESIFLSSRTMVNSFSVETTSTTLIPSQTSAFRI